MFSLHALSLGASLGPLHIIAKNAGKRKWALSFGPRRKARIGGSFFAKR